MPYLPALKPRKSYAPLLDAHLSLELELQAIEDLRDVLNTAESKNAILELQTRFNDYKKGATNFRCAVYLFSCPKTLYVYSEFMDENPIDTSDPSWIPSRFFLISLLVLLTSISICSSPEYTRLMPKLFSGWYDSPTGKNSAGTKKISPLLPHEMTSLDNQILSEYSALFNPAFLKLHDPQVTGMVYI